MIKILGAALIVISAGAVGMRMAGSVRQEERCLRQLGAVVERMLCEIPGRHTPALELFEQAAAQTSGPLKRVFCACEEQISRMDGTDVRTIMEAALDDQEEHVPHTCAHLLRNLGAVLGAYETDEQVEALQALSGRIELALKELRQGKADRCRTYEVLCVCAGCALAIILL